jgi:hypothetical protein
MTDRPAPGAALPVRFPPPKPGRPPFLERGWVFWVCMAAAGVAPAVLLLSRLEVQSTPTMFALVMGWLGCIGALVFATAWVFDPERFFREGGLLGGTWTGYALKILAVLHAVVALRLGCHLLTMLQEGEPEPWRDPQTAMRVMVAIAVVWCWGLTALAYLVGDARVRRARRERAEANAREARLAAGWVRGSQGR